MKKGLEEQLALIAEAVRATVRTYLRSVPNLRQEAVGRTDIVLALLRINTPDSLREAGRLVGRPITVCPPSLPPWPPAPVQPRGKGPRVLRVAPNPCLPSTDAHRRYGEVKKGMTIEQLKSRGITTRDLRTWKKHVEFTT